MSFLPSPRKARNRLTCFARPRLEALEGRIAPAAFTFDSLDVPLSIPHKGQIVSMLEVNTALTMDDVDVQLDISHTRDKDLDVFLIGPDGTRVELFTDVGGNDDDFQGTVLDDEAATAIPFGSAPFAGSFRPEGTLSVFDGTDAQGTWKLEITDDQNQQSGTLHSWSIEVTPAQPPVPTLTIDDVTVTEGDGTIRFIDAFVPAGGTLDAPLGMVTGPDGNLYVSSRNSNEVLRYDAATGAFIDAFVTAGSNGLDAPRALEFGPDGNLYVVSALTDSVLRYNGTTGAFIDEFVAAANGLDNPYGLDFGADGNLYVSSLDGGDLDTGDIKRFDGTTGAYIDTFVSSGSGGLADPRKVSFADGNLYVAGTGSNAVLRYNGTTGAFIDEFVATGSGGLDTPFEFTFGPDENFYVTSTLNGSNKVLRYQGLNGSQPGAFIDEYVTAGSGGLAGPAGLVFDADGNLYVASAQTDEVLRYGAASQAAFTVSLTTASAVPVTVDYTTADGTATAGSDYTARSGTLTFAPGVTSRTIIVPTIDDALVESNETFVIDLGNPSSGAIFADDDDQGVATINDDDAPPSATKFFVTDTSADQTFEYDSSGNALAGDHWALAPGNTNPRGAAANSSGSRVWVVDTSDGIYVYDGDGALQGNWSAAGLGRAEGIATDGAHIWVLDGQNDLVLRYDNAAAFTSGTHQPDSSFSLWSGNENPKGITTDGTSLWVLDDDKGNNDDNVWRYTLSGTFEGGWSLDPANSKPSGLTVDPTGQSQSIWVVDAGADQVFEYANALGTGGGPLAGTFALAPGNSNPQGIADPPPAGSPTAATSPPGWFGDATPWEDSEFTTPGDQGEQSHMDLLTAVMHELGHLPGMEHEDEGVMAETLNPGTRSLDRTGAVPLLGLPSDSPAILVPDAAGSMVRAEVAVTDSAFSFWAEWQQLSLALAHSEDNNP